jgi:hypothetical protein
LGATDELGPDIPEIGAGGSAGLMGFAVLAMVVCCGTDEEGVVAKEFMDESAEYPPSLVDVPIDLCCCSPSSDLPCVASLPALFL